MVLRHMIASQISSLRGYLLATDDNVVVAEPTDDSASVPSVAPPEAPVEHLRRAIAAARGVHGVVPDPRVYSELRLLLNQIESGKVSSAPTKELAVTPPPLWQPEMTRRFAKKPQRRLSVRRAFRIAKRALW